MIRFSFLSKGPLLVTCAAMIYSATPLAAQPSFAGYLSAGYASDPGWRSGDADEQNGTVGGGLFLSVSRRFSLGLELGHHFGVAEGSSEGYFESEVQKEVIRRLESESSLSWATASARFDISGGNVKPYAVAGVGQYFLRDRRYDEIRDATGATVPGFPDFKETNLIRYTGLNVGIGADRARLVGPLGIGVEARWHLVFSGGADFETVFPRFVTLERYCLCANICYCMQECR